MAVPRSNGANIAFDLQLQLCPATRGLDGIKATVRQHCKVNGGDPEPAIARLVHRIENLIVELGIKVKHCQFVLIENHDVQILFLVIRALFWRQG